MAKRFILLNGPPHCGKDMIVSQLIPYIKFKHMKFADPLKDRLCCMLDVDRRELERIKDTPHKLLRKAGSLECHSPREELIYDSENHLKPRYGEDIFGRIFSNRAKNSLDELIIASDCGFDIEVERVIADNGKHNVRIIRIHRAHTTFDGDSRSYLLTRACNSFDLYNDADRHKITMSVLRIIIREFPEFQQELIREPDWIK